MNHADDCQGYVDRTTPRYPRVRCSFCDTWQTLEYVEVGEDLLKRLEAIHWGNRRGVIACPLCLRYPKERPT